MAGRLADEIKQTRPFTSLEGEAVLNLMRTSEAALQSSNLVLKQFDLMLTQFNVLRILCGAVTHGIACSELAERLVARDPDITRLLDRMEQKRLVRRSRDLTDRRIVVAMHTPEGLAILKAAEAPLRKNMERIMSALSRQEVLTLIENLERIRAILS